MMNDMGWDDDDDDLDLESDDDSSSENPVDSAIHMGQGLLFGGLSRLMEAVTQPDTSSLGLDATQDGWNDDDGLDELVVDEQDDDDDGWQEDHDVLENVMVQEEEEPLQPSQLLPVVPAPTPVAQQQSQEQSGWDDDLDGLEDESLHEESQIHTGSGWDDDDVALEGLDDSLAVQESPVPDVPLSPQPPVQAVPPPPPPPEGAVDNGGGWDDEDDALEGLDEVEETPASAVPPPPSVDDMNNGGWDIDEDALEGLEDSPVKGPPVPPPPPAPQEDNTGGGGGWDHDSLDDLQDHDETAHVDKSPPHDEDGWGDLDDDDDFETTHETVVVDHVPTPPRTPRRTESMMTNADESTVLRENARDDQEFEPSDGDYGPVVDHLPPPDEASHTASQTISTIVPESCAETLEEENVDGTTKPEESTMQAIVDHVPDDVSNVPTSNNDDSTASVDGDEPSDMPMQESALRGSTTTSVNNLFGRVVDRMPLEHQHMPHASHSLSTNVPSSLNESLEESTNKETLEVDHVPDDIQDVPMKNDDSMASVDGDETFDTREKDSKIGASVVQEPLEVDHVPDDVSNVSSSKNDDSTASVDGDEPSDLPDREEALESETNEVGFGRVVDHMPSQHAVDQPDRTVASIAPSSVNDELTEDVDQIEANGVGSEQAVASTRRYPGLVDHVPEDSSKSTNRASILAAATQMSVASELSNTLGDEALESDVDAQEENYGPVVDHTPLNQSIHSRRNPSIKVQAPIEELDEESDDDEEQYFGPVVDHTPAVQASAVCSVAGSMAVAAPPSEVNEDSDDDSDGRSDTNDRQEGEASDFCDDDTLDAPTASLVSASKYGPTLVDHVPNRPEARPTDASTLVVVDPSEVSTVGDMTYEEQQYGPVVDHLPTARSAQASAAGSTVNADAATASVGPDDTLVDDMDDVVDGREHDENESEGDDGATLPTLDNPPPMETNVVDHVPEEGPRDFRIDSVLTTAPTQSVLSPDETRDSEFGLVVDHLPTMRLPGPPSRGSMAVLVPESVLDADTESGLAEEEASVPAGQQPASERTTEEAKVVVDHLPPARESVSIFSRDSTATVRSHISEDDTLEGIARPDRFGPVVDQLPASGVSFQRSLGGGSTTGALATLSEVNDDTIVDEDAPGWDYDEQELDSIQGTENSSRQARVRPASRGLSVTFSHETVKTVQNLGDGEGSNDFFTSIADETQYFDADTGTIPSKVNETQESQYFDPESGEMVDHEAVNSAQDQAASLHINGDSKVSASPAMKCTSCDEATGAECPCIQRILGTNADEDAMIVSVTTPEGVQVDLDVKKLLQDETTKRLLLEKELEALKSTVGSLETIISQGEKASAEDKRTTDELRESADMVMKELDVLRGQRDASESQNEELSAQLAALRSEVSDHTREAEEWTTREAALRAEVENLRQAHEESRSESQQLANMGDELASEVDQMRNANEELLIELDRRKAQCYALEAENKGLVEDCAAKERMLSDVAQEKSDLSSRKSALEDETLQLRRALEESSLAATSETDLRNQLSSLQIEAATKSGECEELRAQIGDFQKKLQESEGRCFAQMKESTRTKRLHDGAIQNLQDQLQSLEKSKQAGVGDHEATVKTLHDKISRTNSELQALKSEHESLNATINETRNKYEDQLRQERSSFQAQISQSRALETKVKMLETAKAKASEDLASMRLQLQDSIQQVNASVALKEESESLLETLAVNKETIRSLQEQVEVLSKANKSGTDQMESLVQSVSSERDTLRNTLQSKEKEMLSLQSELDARSSEKASLEERLETLAAKCGEMEASVEELQSNVIRKERELAEKERLCESLRESQSQLDTESASQARLEYEREVSSLTQLASEREESLRQVQSQLEDQVNAIRSRDVTISQLEQQRAEMQGRMTALTSDRDNTLSRFRELDAELARTKEQLTSLEESSKHSSERERELHTNLEALTIERDAALKEREMLEEDSEELLVQLGLMKEQLDAHGTQVGELQQIIAEKEIAVKHAEDRLREAEGYIAELSRTEDEPQENGDHEPGKLAELERTIEELTLEKEDLQQRVDDLSSTNAYIDAQVTSLRDEKVELLSKLSEMDKRAEDSGADASAREEQYQERARELEEQCRHLEEVCRLKDEELARAKSSLEEAQASSDASKADIDSLQRQIAELQNACTEQGHALHDRDKALEDMMLEMEGLRSQSAAASNAAGQMDAATNVDELSRKLQHAERSAQHYQERLRELQVGLEQARRELKLKTEKLSETESTLFDRELELDLQDQENGVQGDLQKQLHEMEALLQQRNQEIQDAFERERSLKQSLDELQNNGRPLENGPSSNAVEETRQLRSQLSALQQQLESSTSHHGEREARARHEVITLNETIARKKEQIESLEAQLQSLSVEFSSSQDQLVSKEADFRRLSMELEETLGDQLQSTRTVTSQVLESSSKEQAESVDNMRAHIISLAQALERSETQRADAIERLLKERKASADSLRRLGESVKRFYSSLSYRDA